VTVVRAEYPIWAYSGGEQLAIQTSRPRSAKGLTEAPPGRRGSIMNGRIPLGLAVFLTLAGCGSHDREEYRRWYIPLDNSARAAKEPAQVAFLEAEPTNRKFVVLGIIAPPDDKFDSFGETVNAIRAAAALYVMFSPPSRQEEQLAVLLSEFARKRTSSNRHRYALAGSPG
jgi:hypothetical protein